jgi:hypothetical protein
MKVILEDDFELYVHDISYDRSVIYKGITVLLKYDVFVLSDLGDCYLEETGVVNKIEGDVNLFKLFTRATVQTEHGKKHLISKDLKKDSMYARNVDQLIGEPSDREINATNSRRWKARLCRDISEIKESNRFALCRGVDGVWFLLR